MGAKTLILPNNRGYVAQTGDISGRNLIVDSFSMKLMRNETVNESVGGTMQKILRFGGRFQYADKLNANQRFYPFPVLKEAVESIQSDVKSRGVLGEFDHPADAKVHLDRVSHLITKLWMEGKEVFGECEVIANTTYGMQLKALLESKVRIGISSRGVGDMESTLHEGVEAYKVMPGFMIVTFDVVAEPSVHNSYMSVKESIEKKTKINHTQVNEKAILEEVQKFLRQKR